MKKVVKDRPGYWRDRALMAESKLAAIVWGLFIGFGILVAIVMLIPAH